MKKILNQYKKVIIPVAVVCLALVAMSTLGLAKSDGGGDTPEEIAEQIVNVETTAVYPTSLFDELSYTGTTKPKDTVNVLSSLSGKVDKVYYTAGDQVLEGDTLFTMDTADIENSLRIAQANVTSADASVRSAQTTLELSNGATMQMQIESSASAVNNAQIAVENARLKLDNSALAYNKAQTDYESYTILFESGVISQTDFDNAQRAYEQSQNDYNQTKLALENAEYTLEQAKKTYDLTANDSPQENIKKAQAALDQATASRAAAQAQLISNQKSLADAVVKSPISGTVLECNVNEKAMLQSGVAPFIIISLDPVVIEVNVAENVVNDIALGSSVVVQIESVSSDAFTGFVSSKSPGANADGTFKVEIEVPNPDMLIKSGMFAEVGFIKEQRENTYLIPESAILFENGDYYVYAIDNGIAQRVSVTTGIDKGEYTEITSGLTEGMLLVTKGQNYISDGTAVNDLSNSDQNEIEADPSLKEE